MPFHSNLRVEHRLRRQHIPLLQDTRCLIDIRPFSTMGHVDSCPGSSLRKPIYMIPVKMYAIPTPIQGFHWHGCTFPVDGGAPWTLRDGKVECLDPGLRSRICLACGPDTTLSEPLPGCRMDAYRTLTVFPMPPRQYPGLPWKPCIRGKMRRLLRIGIFAEIVWISCFSSALCNLLHTLTVWLDGVGRWQLPATDQRVL